MLLPTDSLEVNLERAAGDVIDGEAIIIDLATGVYYSMQGIGGLIWSMIDARQSVGAMHDRIVATFDVDPDEARRDLHSVLDQLLAEGLVQRSAEGAEAGPAVPADTVRTAYARPALQIYRDMQELLALDPPAPGMNRIAWNDKGDPAPK